MSHCPIIEVGIWYQGKFGNPRTAANHSIPGKAEKAAKARERFAKTGELLAFIEGEEDDDMLDEQPSNNT